LSVAWIVTAAILLSSTILYRLLEATQKHKDQDLEKM